MVASSFLAATGDPPPIDHHRWRIRRQRMIGGGLDNDSDFSPPRRVDNAMDSSSFLAEEIEARPPRPSSASLSSSLALSPYALLVDADNASPNSFDLAMREIKQRGLSVPIRRIYGKNTLLDREVWQNVIRTYSFVPIACPGLVDMALAVDAMDLLYTKKHFLHGFILFSSDADFARLAQRIREENLLVLGIGQRLKLNAAATLPRACHEYICTEDLVRTEMRRLGEVRVRNLQMEKAQRQAERKLAREEVDRIQAVEDAAKREAEQQRANEEAAARQAMEEEKAKRQAEQQAAAQKAVAASTRFHNPWQSLRKAFQSVWGPGTAWGLTTAATTTEENVVLPPRNITTYTDDDTSSSDAATIDDEDDDVDSSNENSYSINSVFSSSGQTGEAMKKRIVPVVKNDSIAATTTATACALVVQTLRTELQTLAPDNEWVYLSYLAMESSCDVNGTGYTKLSALLRAHPDDFELTNEGTTYKVRLRRQ